jgi:nucleotide-binding universal stress UspA family protein
MFKRILLAIDDTDSGQVAISFTIALANTEGASVRVMHVNEFQLGGRGFTVETSEEASRLLDHAVYQLLSAGVEASGIVALATCFSVSQRIVDEAHEWAADVIVLGSRRRGHLGRFLGNKVPEKVTRLSELPVLTAPAPLRVRRKGRGFVRHREEARPSRPLASVDGDGQEANR